MKLEIVNKRYYIFISVLLFSFLLVSFVLNQIHASNLRYFKEAKFSREEIYKNTITALKSIIDDKRSDQTEKDAAATRIVNLAIKKNHEARIETVLKLHGFREVLCFLEDDRARVIVYARKLSENELEYIKEVVYSVSHTSNIEINTRY